MKAIKAKLEKDLAAQKKADEAKIAKIVAEAKKTLEAQIMDNKKEMDTLKTQNVVKLTQQIAKDKADSERQIRVQQALTDTMIKNAVALYKKQLEAKEKSQLLTQTKNEQAQAEKYHQLEKVDKAKIATLEAVLKQKSENEAKMAKELKEMKDKNAKMVADNEKQKKLDAENKKQQA